MGDSDGRQSVLAHFMDACGVDEPTARAHLDAAGGDIAAALSAFFDGSGGVEDDEDEDDLDEDGDDVGDGGELGGADLDQRLLDSAERVPARGHANGGGGGGGDMDATSGGDTRAALPRAFTGAGYSLAGGRLEPGASAPAAAASADEGDELTTRTIMITFWADGFSVDDGPLRDPHDPPSRLFLKMLEMKVLPPELRQLDSRGRPVRVEVQLRDMRTQPYAPPPPPAFRAFTGEGRTLGGAEPETATPGGAAEPAAAAAAAVVAKANGDAGSAGEGAGEGAGESGFAVDEARPTTTVQVRLADGARLRVRLNLDSTVGDLYRFVAQAAVGTRERQRLLAGFPPVELADRGLTIAAAGLEGAAVTQRLA